MKRPFYKSQQLAKQKEQLTPLKNFAVQPVLKFLLLLLIAGYAMPAFSQWTLLNSGVTNTLRAPFFINADVGIIVGEPIAPDQAVILKTTDGGLTWASKVSGTTNALRGVQFIDNATGFAVGFTGTILKTIDAEKHGPLFRVEQRRHYARSISPRMISDTFAECGHHAQNNECRSYLDHSNHGPYPGSYQCALLQR
jgi:hypothetical protein